MMENLQSISARPIAGPLPAFGNDRTAGEKPSKIQGDILDLSPEAQAQLRKLKQRDAEVRAHEKAHLAAAGGNAVGAPHYEYQKGPDGRQYAIGGHVDISLSSVEGDPEESEKRAREVRQAALAPGQPSGQDRAVAAQAASMEAKAKAEKLGEEPEEERTASGRKEMDSLAAAGKLSANPWEDRQANAPEKAVFRRRALEIYDRLALAGSMKSAFGEDITTFSIAV